MNRFILLLLIAFAGSDLQAQWTRGEGAGIYFNSFVDTESGLLATSDAGGLYKSHDDGRTWSEIPTGLWEMSFPTKAVLVRENLMFIASTGGGVARSTDNGTTWSAANSGFPQQAFVTSLALLGDTLYAGMDPTMFSGQIFKTSIDSIDWKRSDAGMPGRRAVVQGLVATDGGVLFVCFASETAPYAKNVYVSFDSAGSWQPIPVEQALSVYGLVVDGSRLYAVAGSGLFLLTDGAITWRQIGEIPSELLVASVAGQTMYAGTLDSGIFASSNGGESWQPVNEGLPYLVDSPLAVWTDGTTALASLNLNSRTWYRSILSHRDEASAAPGVELSLAPNPSRVATRIGYHLPEGGEVSLRLYNLSGGEILAIEQGWKQSGDHAIDLDIVDLPPGVYFVALQVGGERWMRRLFVER